MVVLERCLIALVVWSGWDNEFGMARKGFGWLGAVLVILKNILVIESCLGGLYWFMVVLE